MVRLRAIAMAALIALVACRPEITRIAPVSSKIEGGGELIVEGRNLDRGTAAITIGTSPAPIESRTGERVVARIPAGQLGPSQLRVTVGTELQETREFSYAIERIVTVARADEAGRVQRVALASRKEALLAAVAPLGVTVASDQPDLPTMVLRIPSAEALAAVEANENVAGSSALLEVRPDTTESLPLIHQDWVRALPEPLGGPFIGHGTTVLVLDSGLDWRNPFFRCPTLTTPGCRVTRMIEFAGQDGTDEDTTFHGTNVAAIVLSVAPGARVISGDLLGTGTTTEAIVNAIQWAIENRATYNIASVNMSFSVPGTETRDFCYTNPIAAAVNFARFSGLVMVASTSNDFYTDRVLVPACSPGAVRVGAVYDSGPNVDTETDFSNGWNWEYIVAPGEYIRAAGHTMRGTSQAAPHVAGAAAVLRSAFPTASVDFIMSRLRRSGPIVPSKNPVVQRVRRLDLYAAMVDQMWRPAPPPEHFEWTWVRIFDGVPAPVADRPRLEIQPNPRFARDRNTGLTWFRALPSDPAPAATDIRRAQEYCRTPERIYRLPTRSELMTLVDMTAMRGERLDRSVLGPGPAGQVWTISPRDRYSDEGETVWAFDEGYMYYGSAPGGVAGTLCVYAGGLVPDEAPAQHFLDEGITVLDNASQLRWLKATGPQLDYFQASDWCAARTDGGRFWRLPTARELLSITSVVRTNGNSTDIVLFGAPGTRITASDHPADQGSASPYGWWVVNEAQAITNGSQISGTVRCVENRDPRAARDAVHVGDVVIDGDEADARYQRFDSNGYREVRGNVLINAPGVPRLLLQRLERIDGSLYIGNMSNADLIALPYLTEVTGGIYIEQNAAKRIDLRRLQRVTGDIRIANNSRLGIDQPSGTNGDGQDAPLLLGQLQSVGGSLQIERNPHLKAFGFGMLTHVGREVDVVSNQRLELFRWLRLATVGTDCPMGTVCGMMAVTGNPVLFHFSASQMQEIRWGINVQNNSVLTGFSVAGARMHALYRVTGNVMLCAYTATDGGLRNSLSKGMIDDIEVTGNMSDTPTQRCSSRCPDEDRCELIGPSTMRATRRSEPRRFRRVSR